MRRKTKARKAPIDWADVRARLTGAKAATERVFEMSPARTAQILDERARALARVPDSTAPSGSSTPALAFALAGERYGIDCRYVREVLRLTNYTRVPGPLGFLTGITNARGEILAIVDLGRLLGREPRGVTDLSRLIVLGREHAEFGILVDDVREVVEVNLDAVSDVSRGAAGFENQYLRWIWADGTLVLDGERLLGDRNLFVDHGDRTSRQARRRGAE